MEKNGHKMVKKWQKSGKKMVKKWPKEAKKHQKSPQIPQSSKFYSFGKKG